MFIGSEVGLVQHGISIQDTYYRDMVEVETFRNHLRANQNIGTTGREVTDNTFVGITRASGVEVHTRNPCLRKNLSHLFLNLLCTKATRAQIGTTTTRTLRRHMIGIPTIMTRQLIHLTVICQRHVTVLTRRHPTTLMTLDDWCKAAAILKEDGLFSMLQSLAHAR